MSSSSTDHGGLETLLRPGSVAIIGASEDARTYAGAPVSNLLRTQFSGAIYPVNLSRETVQGVPAFKSVLDVPGAIDTAIVAVPTRAVVGVLEQCVEKGVRSATIVTSGFGEDTGGEAGVQAAAALREVMRSSGIRVLGPNTAGLANPLDGYVPRAASNQLDPDRVSAGGVALLTQSGAMGNTVFNRAQVHGVRVGLSVATGDQMDVDVWELCGFALDDPRIKIAMLIVERIDAGALERVALKAAATGKTIALLKLGRSAAGGRAVLTHSGSLAGDAAVQSAALRALGVIEVDDLDELWHVARLAESWGPPCRPLGRLGIVALSGGEGALIADHCEANGLDLADVSPTFEQVIAENFDYALAANPFDPSGEVIGKPEKVKLALRAFLERNDFSEVLIASPVLRGEIAERQYADLAEIVAEPRPRMCLSYWPAGDLTQTQDELLRATGLPVFTSSTAALRAMALYGRAVRSRGPVVENGAAQPGALAPDARYFDVRAELAGLGVAFADAELAFSPVQAGEAAQRIGLPVVMKANVPSSTHKLANGLIALGVTMPADVERAFTALTAAGAGFEGDGVVVEATAGGRLEVMLGAHRDPDFGAVIVVGSGGSLVEHLGDTALAVARYLGAGDALTLLRATRVGAHIAEVAPGTATQLAELIAAVARWFEANPQLAGADLNPLVVDVHAGRILAVDARVA
jgi:acetate---CoA ligase (ADP-forming)